MCFFLDKWGIDFPLFLAPMAGVTDLVFRSICKELGADVLVTEFVSADGILQNNERTRKYTKFLESHRPVGVQLFGADGERMGEAAVSVIADKKPDFIDINFGCPVKKVVSKCGGSSLLKDVERLAGVARAMVNAVNGKVPVSAKIRIGWDSVSINAKEVCQILEECGMAFIAIHGRTKSQGYSGKANWDVIAECAETVKIPVIGNGDICSVNDVKVKRDGYGISGVMIGRAAMSNPWIFQEAKDFLARGEIPEPVSLREKWDLILRHCRDLVKHGQFSSESYAVISLRSRLMSYTRGMPAGKDLRRKISTVSSYSDVEEVALEYLQNKFYIN